MSTDIVWFQQCMSEARLHTSPCKMHILQYFYRFVSFQRISETPLHTSPCLIGNLSTGTTLHIGGQCARVHVRACACVRANVRVCALVCSRAHGCVMCLCVLRVCVIALSVSVHICIICVYVSVCVRCRVSVCPSLCFPD